MISVFCFSIILLLQTIAQKIISECFLHLQQNLVCFCPKSFHIRKTYLLLFRLFLGISSDPLLSSNKVVLPKLGREKGKAHTI